MTPEPWFWIVFTVMAAAAQSGRNAMQRDLVERLRRGAPLNTHDVSTFYGGGEKGYTDYPTL